MIRTLVSTLVLMVPLAGAALAQAPAETPASAPARAPVYCATYTCFEFRAPASGQDAEARALHAMDVINKFLGGSIGKVSTKVSGKNIRLLLNNELVAIITPADAAAEKQKTPAALAAIWSRELSKAFEASKAQP